MSRPSARHLFVQRVHQAYPDTDVDRLVQAGIRPVPPQVNYIPTTSSRTQKTTGVF